MTSGALRVRVSFLSAAVEDLQARLTAVEAQAQAPVGSALPSPRAAAAEVPGERAEADGAGERGEEEEEEEEENLSLLSYAGFLPPGRCHGEVLQLVDSGLHFLLVHLIKCLFLTKNSHQNRLQTGSLDCSWNPWNNLINPLFYLEG
mmetsp:Transcript_14939/g.23557  ORF Transcript_14939/g.23557 Transcript_14939/m.23557 type:complete len:147 (+) Transcript_14939:896-1336(+)